VIGNLWFVILKTQIRSGFKSQITNHLSQISKC
jgi:hypothetical protein